MKYAKMLFGTNPTSENQVSDLARITVDNIVAELALDGVSTKGRWVVTVEFTPEADLELERCCTCPVEGLGVHAWYGPCADGKGHAHQCAVAIAAMKEAKWPCGKLKYPELSES